MNDWKTQTKSNSTMTKTVNAKPTNATQRSVNNGANKDVVSVTETEINHKVYRRKQDQSMGNFRQQPIAPRPRR